MDCPILREAHRADMKRRQHITVDEAFACFIERLRETRRGRPSLRQDLVRMFWCWNDRPWRGPVLDPAFPLKQLATAFRPSNYGAIDDQVVRFFYWMARSGKVQLEDYMPAASAKAVRSKLAAAYQEAWLNRNRRSNTAISAVDYWQSFFGPKFPRLRREAGLPLLP